MHRNRPHHQQQQQEEEAKAENMWQKLHRETAEAREFVTAAIAEDHDLAGAVEGRTPNLPTQMADLWPLYIAFLRLWSTESAAEHWRLFCEWSTATAELEI